MINDLDMQGWAYLLAPTFQFVNTAGKPLTEGYLEVYIADTRNKYYCASDFDGTLHPFQIPLDSLGSNIVLADPSQAYDVYVYNRFGSLVMSRYNVSPSNAGGSGVLTITISSNDNTVQVVKDSNNYDLSIADTISRIDNIEDRLDEIGDGSVGYAIAHSELASGGLFNLTDDKNKDIDYTSDMHGFRLKPGHVYQLNFNANFDCNNDTNDLISGKFYLDGDSAISQDWNFNVDNSFEHQESINGSTVLVIPSDVSYYDVKLKYSFDDEALDLYLNKISIVDVTSIVSQGASGGGVVYTDGDGIIVDNSNHTINVDMDYINSHLDIDASSILSSAYNYTDASVSQVSGDLINVIAEATGNLPIPEQVQSDWEEDNTSSPAYIQHKPEQEEVEFEEINLNDYALASAIPDVSNLATKDELNTASGNIINYVDNSIGNVTNVIESVSGDLQEQIDNIPAQVQSDWTQTDNTQVDYIKNKPEQEEVNFEEINLSDYALASAVPSVEGLATVAQVSSVSSVLQNEIDNIPEQVNADWNSNSGKSEILNKPDLSIYATVNQLNEVSGDIISQIPDAQVQSNWTEDDTTDPSYILNKPNELELVAGDNIEIAVSGTNIVISSTVSAVTGLDLLYGKFTSNNVSTTATMAKSKGNINVSDGKIQLEQGKSYHITVRGYYQQTNAANSYSPISFVEYITSNPINIDIDRSRTDAQYFELSYDLFNLNSDTDYQVAFSGGAGLVKDLVIEIHSLGGAGTGSSSGGSAIEYDAGYGINIANQVISVDSSIIPNTNTLATKAEVANVSGTIVGMIPNTSNLATKAELNSASANIVGQIPDVSNYATTTDLTNACNNVISMIPDVPESVNLIAGANITIAASGNDYVISSTGGGGSGETYTAGNGLNLVGNEFSVDTSVVATQSDLGDVEAEVQAVSSAIPTLPQEEEVEFEELDLSNYALASAIPDVSNLATKTEVQEVSAAIPQSSNLIPGNNITITASGDDYVISSTGGGGGGTTYTAGTGIDITNDVISIDNTVALKSEIPDTSDMATKTWVGNQGYLTSVPSQYITETELSSELDDYALKTDIPDPVSGASGITVTDNVISLDNPVGLVAGENITITVSGSSAIIAGQAGGSSYTAGTGIDITSDVISIDNTVVATKSWIGNELSNYALASAVPPDNVRKINFNPSATLYSQQIQAWLNNNKFVYLNILPASLPSSPDVLQYLFASGGGNLVLNNFVVNNYVTFSGICRNYLTESDYTVVFTYTFGSNSWSYSCNRLITYTKDISNLATKAEVQTVSAAIPDTTGMITYSGNTAINHIQLVSSLPASPDANTLYLIPEV